MKSNILCACALLVFSNCVFSVKTTDCQSYDCIDFRLGNPDAATIATFSDAVDTIIQKHGEVWLVLGESLAAPHAIYRFANPSWIFLDPMGTSGAMGGIEGNMQKRMTSCGRLGINGDISALEKLPHLEGKLSYIVDDPGVLCHRDRYSDYDGRTESGDELCEEDALAFKKLEESNEEMLRALWASRENVRGKEEKEKIEKKYTEKSDQFAEDKKRIFATLKRKEKRLSFDDITSLWKPLKPGGMLTTSLDVLGNLSDTQIEALKKIYKIKYLPITEDVAKPYKDIEFSSEHPAKFKNNKKHTDTERIGLTKMAMCRPELKSLFNADTGNIRLYSLA